MVALARDAVPLRQMSGRPLVQRRPLSPHEAKRALSHPALYASIVLGHKLTPMQISILDDMSKPNAHTAAKGCHGSGKTFDAVALVLWFLSAYADGIVITTAPTWTQVKRVIWAEAHRQAKAVGMKFPKMNETEFALDENNYAIGISTNESTRFQGFHGRVLILVEEAPGVFIALWDAIGGIEAGGDVRVLALGNPTVAAGPFFEIWAQRKAGWKRYTVSAFDTPNLKGCTLDDVIHRAEDDPWLDDNVQPKMITRRYVWLKYFEWGLDSPNFQARVLGQFPQQGSNSVFRQGWLTQAGSPSLLTDDEPVVAGLDIAGPGEDETVLVVRGLLTKRLIAMHAWNKDDALPYVVEALNPYKRSGRLRVVNGDADGIGWYLLKNLQRAPYGFPVVGVQSGSTAKAPERFVNTKAEMTWALRERFERDEIRGMTDPLLLTQATALTYSVNHDGAIAIEDKKAYKKRLHQSPDRLEALILAYYNDKAGGSFEGQPRHKAGRQTGKVSRTVRAARAARSV